MTGIYLDYRTGSGELEPLFAPFGVQVCRKTLAFGDFAFEGNGPFGTTAIVIERKRIEDLIDSMKTRRLSGHQLPGMAEHYDYCYLIVEGLWRPGEVGQIEIGHGTLDGEARFGGSWYGGRGRGGMHYRAIDNYLSTLELQAGVIYRRTLTPLETVWQVVDLYRYWQDKLWIQHDAHKAVYAPAVPLGGRRISLVRREASVLEMMAMQLPGVGDKAEAVGKHLGAIIPVTTPAYWQEVKGVGKVTAKKIVEALRADI